MQRETGQNKKCRQFLIFAWVPKKRLWPSMSVPPPTPHRVQKGSRTDLPAFQLGFFMSTSTSPLWPLLNIEVAQYLTLGPF